MNPSVSVVVPTHNPHPGRLARTISSLRAQLLTTDQWELVIVDNCSSIPITVDLTWHPSAQVIREERLGLTCARLAGAAATSGRILVFVDDDNVLAWDYLETVIRVFAENSQLGAAGGKSIPDWEILPPAWVMEFADKLALRDLGENVRIEQYSVETGYPARAPVGAGMAISRAAWDVYSSSVANASAAPADRTGQELTSGGDNDIVMHIMRAGWHVGYFPQLVLTHLIPARRLTKDYLARLNYGISKSWVQVLGQHGIHPWPPSTRWTVPLRKLRAYFRYRAWLGPAQYVRWKGACGQFEGRLLIG